MESRFDKLISRSGTSTLKYDNRLRVFGAADVVPLWVADMDFAVADEIRIALMQRAEHPVYGYTVYPESLFEAQMRWLATQHFWNIEQSSILFCPGVVPSLHACILALSQPGEGVIVQPPVYAPFLAAPEICGRQLFLNPLRLDDGEYCFDLEDLERCAQLGGRLLLLCSPHNPVGRVWRRDELLALLDVCERHDITVVSDEIHADLIYPGLRHIPLATLNSSVEIITAVAPSKTFNIPGLGLSALIAPSPAQRVAINKVFDALHLSACNPFSIVAYEAAYREGTPWLDELMEYLADTRDMALEFLHQRLPQIALTAPAGTYLLWLDFRALGLADRQLAEFLVIQAGVGLSPGITFGAQGSGFMRMNIGAPRSVIRQALVNIARAIAML
jgi:cystathionine beta-lyase